MAEVDKEQVILEIGESISFHRELEHKERAWNLAVGLANVEYSGKDQKFWIVNSENTRGVQKISGVHGEYSGVNAGPKTTIEDDGYPIYKNTKIGECLIRNSVGTHLITVPVGKMPLKIENTAFFTPNPHSSEAIDLKINLNEGKPRLYQSLKNLLEVIHLADSEIIELHRIEEDIVKSEDESALNDVLDKLKIAEAKRNKAFANAQNFIRKNAELRAQPILDPYQDEVKRSNIFDATVAIDGGPGTGKTTSLIQRIKFLVDIDAMSEYRPDLTQGQKDKLFANDENWMFFSPSELLKLFLKNNMLSEGLVADDNKVMVWGQHKANLIKRYGLIDTETQLPFLALRKNAERNILPHRSTDLKKILKAFDEFYLKFQIEKLEKIKSIDCDGYVWKNVGKSIQNYLSQQDSRINLRTLIQLYFNLQENYSNEVKSFVKDYNESLDKASAKIIVQLNEETDKKTELIELISSWKKSKENVEEEEEEIANDDLINDEEALFGRIKGLIRKTALSKYDTGVKLTAKDIEFNTVLKEKIDVSSDVSNIDKIGELAYFIKYFENSTRGIVSNLVSDIPRLYKSFRKDQLKKRELKWNYSILEYIVNEDSKKNKRIHPNEQAFLLYFINSLVKRSYSVSRAKTQNVGNAYFEAYNKYSRPVIGVDEATDFHLIDLLCIHSFGDYEISSVTYSGDLMQRLTKEGIRDWKELGTFIGFFELKELRVSYRQSPTLLKLAEVIYRKAIGDLAHYQSFMDKDENEPKPLYYINQDEDDTVEWIGDRIIEIYKAYGNSIPSIAIFLSSEDQIFSFAEKLGEIDRLADVDIRVKACNNGQVLGDANTVRVFSVDYIKGLEFEAVFFHNINQLFKKTGTDLVLKSLYVGLSRATFYLGITASKENEKLEFLKEYLEQEELHWKIA